MKNKLTGFNGFCCPNDKSANQYAIINHLKNYLMKNRKFDKKIAILRNQTSSAIFEIIYSYLQTYDNIIYIDANDVVNFFKKNHEKIAFTIVTTSTFLNNSTSLNKTILSECEKYSIPIHIDATQEFASLIVEDYNLNRKNLDISISLNVKNIIFYNLNICFYAWNSKKSLKFILTKCEIPTEFFKDYYDRLKMPDFLNNLLLHNGNKYLESKEEILKIKSN
ncbi:hypothetical protein [Mycoplasmopsis caviae]|uniref:Cysteine desulfurase n=1 Tax=Mycoplasmopsis caviae TaxID=55603 RepID=A0A3P8MEY6_9BACT|nr:hypothetical protein [Mycoplasmopsis caviae]VDR42496.1 Uncharacterised protein [Mycoplasmopsis caviae]